MPTSPVKSNIWTWFNEPISIRSGNYTYECVINDSGVVGISRYDHVGQTIEIGNVRGSACGPLTADDHNNPAILLLASGKILVALSEHPGACYACLSNASDGTVLCDWTQTQLFDGATYYNAYAHLCQTTDDLGTIWWFFRNGNTSSDGQVGYRVNQNGGAGGSWTANASNVFLIANLTETNNRPYFRIAQSGRRIDILYGNGNPVEHFTTSLYHLYIELNTAGTSYDVRKSDGTLVDTFAITGGTGTVNGKTLPLDVPEGTKIYDGATSRAWVWDAKWISGTLHGLFVTFSQTSVADDTHRYRRCSLSNGTGGGTWSVETICYAGDSTAGGTVGRTPQWLPPDGSPGSNTVYSPGICFDVTNADRVYASQKTGSTVAEIWQWDRVSSSNWTRTSSVTGADGVINARPFGVIGSSGDATWWRATSYPNYVGYTTTNPGALNSRTLARSTKISSPSYNSSAKYPGLKAFYFIYEGTGTTVADITGTYNGTFVGTPTWGSDAYGANLSGFTTSNYVVADALAASGFFDGTTYPKWLHVQYKSTTSGTAQYMAGFGSSAANTQMFAVNVNSLTDNQVAGLYRDNATGSNQLVGTKTRDTAYHTLTIVAESATVTRLFSDGASLLVGTNAIGTTTFNKFAIGVLSRTSIGTPATGVTLSLVAAGSGSTANPMHLHHDSILGQFQPTWAPASSSGGIIFHRRNLRGGFTEMG